MADNKTLYVIDLKDSFSPKIKKADSNYDKFDKNVKKSTSKSGGVGGLISSMPFAAAGIAGVGLAAVAGAKKIVDLGAAMEQTRVSFSVLFGSPEKGNEMLDLMNEFANVTPFTNDKVIQAGKTLRSFGFTAESIAPTLKILGDVSAGTGKDFAELAVIFGQIKGAGRLMGQDLLQLINAGFNPLQIISEKTGESMTSLKDKMSKGQISFEMVQQSFVDATSAGGLFDDMMSKQSKTFSGLVSTIQGKLGALFASSGEGLATALKPILEWTISFIDMLPRINLQPLINAFGMWWQATKDMLSPLTSLFGLMGEGVTMGEALQGAVNGIAAALRFLTLPIRTVKAAFNGLFQFLDDAMEAFRGVGDVIGGIFTFNPAQIAAGITQFESGFGKITESIGGFVDDEIKAFKDIFATQLKEGGGGIDLAGASDLSKLMGAGAAGASGGAAAGAGKKSKVSGNVAGVSSGGIKNVTLNIDKLVEEITFSTTTSTDMTKLKEMVTRVLVEASTDATRLIGT